MYVGIDYHKRYSIATKMDEKGRVLEQVRLSNDLQTLLRYAEGLPAGSKIALEATGTGITSMNSLRINPLRYILPIQDKGNSRGEDKDRQDRLNNPCTSLKDRPATNILYPTKAYKRYERGLEIQGITGLFKDIHKEQGSCDTFKEWY